MKVDLFSYSRCSCLIRGATEAQSAFLPCSSILIALLHGECTNKIACPAQTMSAIKVQRQLLSAPEHFQPAVELVLHLLRCCAITLQLKVAEHVLCTSHKRHAVPRSEICVLMSSTGEGRQGAGADLEGVHEVADAADDEEGGGGVEAGADLVQEQRVLGAHHHLACIVY